MVIECLGGPWDGQIEKVDNRGLTIAVPMPPDVDNKPSKYPRDYTRIGLYHIRQGGPRDGIRYADWLGET